MRRMPSTSADIRAWALVNGHAVGDRGRLPATVVRAYEAAHRPGRNRARTAGTRVGRTTTAAREAPAAGAAVPDVVNSVELAARVSALEDIVAELRARFDAQPAAEPTTQARRGLRRSR